MMHHSLLPHYELQPMIDLWRFYAGWFANHGILTVITGHIHANDISASVSDCGNTVYDIQTGALIASPNTYRELTFSGGADRLQEYHPSGAGGREPAVCPGMGSYSPDGAFRA